jgi:hypothetical protein
MASKIDPIYFVLSNKKMELPDDVLQLVREYAKPSEPYKMYLSVMKILGHGMPLDMREDMTRKLKRATRFHYEQFRHLFLELEKKHDELVIVVDLFCAKDTPYHVRYEYYFKLRHFASNRREVMNKLKEL